MSEMSKVCDITANVKNSLQHGIKNDYEQMASLDRLVTIPKKEGQLNIPYVNNTAHNKEHKILWRMTLTTN